MLGTRSIREWKGGQKYNKVGCIGKGAFAVVYKVTAKFDGIPYAAKELEKRRFMKNGILDMKVETEMNIMRQIQHVSEHESKSDFHANVMQTNVVRFIEHIDWEDKLYIIMEYVPNGDLGSLISQHGSIPEDSVHTMATQLLSALKYLHGKGITHRDVKPDNILIATFNPVHVKLTDFGLSKMINSEETFLRTFCGTLLYCAPEVYQEYREYDMYGQRHRGDKRLLPPQRYGHAVDIWSLAGVLFYALCGFPPYRVKNGVSYQELLNQIMTTPLDIRPLQHKNVSDRGIRFVRKMLHVRPESRATIEQLEQAPWMTGIDDGFDASTQESEGASIVDDFIDPYLQQAGSQLSIHDRDDQLPLHGGDSGVLGTQHETRDEHIPSSFSTEDQSEYAEYEEDSLEYVPATAPHRLGQNGRLFGEVNPSILDQENIDPSRLPLPESGRFVHTDVGEQLDRDILRESVEDNKENIGHVPLTFSGGLMPPPPPDRVMAIRQQAHHGTRPPSLQFAESMVDQLNMNSPAPDFARRLQSPEGVGGGDLDPAAATSLRRSRYEYETDAKTTDWHPEDLPLKRLKPSTRAIELDLPPSVFWDPRDRSTHHYNYPRMSNTEWEAFEDFAGSKGERFRPGESTFDKTMHSYRTSPSRSPSVEKDLRAQSEPTIAEGRRRMMMRDNRHLSTDEDLMDLERSQSSTNTNLSYNDSDLEKFPQTPSEPFVGNDFHPPKKILAKFIPEETSCLPTVAFNIIDLVTTFGRSSTNSLQSIKDKRIPEHAFKLVLFKPGFYNDRGDLNHIQWTKSEQDMKFYISSKSSQTIYVNNTQLLCNDPKHLDTESKYWVELRDGDIVTVWWNQWVQNEVTRFKFECRWGASREPHADWHNLTLVEEGPLLDELEKVCLREEARMAQERARREQEETDSKEREEQRNAREQQRKVVRAKPAVPGPGRTSADRLTTNFSASAPALDSRSGGPIDFNQSFSFQRQED